MPSTNATITDQDGWTNEGRFHQFVFNCALYIKVSDQVARQEGTWCIWISMAPSWYAPERPIKDLQDAKQRALRMAATYLRSLAEFSESEASRIACRAAGIDIV